MNGSEDTPRRLFQKKRRSNKTANKKREGNAPTGREDGKQKQDKNKKESAVLVKESDLKDLSVPSPQQLAALTKLLNTVFTKYGMSKEDLCKRQVVFNNVKQLLQQEIPGCPLRLYGSSLSCLGLKTSDVNIDVNESKEEKVPMIFIMILEILTKCKEYKDVKENFDTKWPTINFTDVKSGLKCKITAGKDSSFFTTCLLKTYGGLDSRVKPLCVSLKLWAQICKVDLEATGTLPSYSFLLMVVHFLQQTNPPVLPVIHEKLGDLTEYFEEKNPTDAILVKIQDEWTSLNTSCLGALWLKLLRYYSNYQRNQETIINVRQEKKVLRSSRNWGKRRFAIEDPFSSKRNVARTLLRDSAYRFIIEHLKLALLYYGSYPGSHCSGDGPPKSHNINHSNTFEKLVEEHQGGNERPANTVKEFDETEEKERSGDSESNDEKLLSETDEDEDRNRDNIELVDGVFAMDTINDSVIIDSESSDIDQVDSVNNHLLTGDTIFSENTSGVHETDISQVIGDNSPENIDATTIDLSEEQSGSWARVEYTFDDSVLRSGPPLESKCSSCRQEGHIDVNCTVEKITPLKNLPPLLDWFKDILTKVCITCKDFGITADEITQRRLCLRGLEAFIRSHFPGARLHLFGSSCNGFGFCESDLDICMTFEGKAKSDIDCVTMITKLAKVLRENPEIKDVIAIIGAKVPIVKFYLKRRRLEADISLYNEVALWNTKLLAMYVDIDHRVNILGCTLKIFVKLCGIGDASRGSLSSYAYILMLLHFLQQRQPPVVPVLQEIYDTKEQPQRMVEGFNCWFCDDINTLRSKWKARNTESCGELWLGFLRYYTETFNYKHNVVCVRSRKTLTKFEKLWNGKEICIEDPFVLSHNLGAGLSIGMAKFIRSTFVRAREKFGTPRRDVPANIPQRQRFFFDPDFLNNGNLPPTGRNCNICGKIGHWAKECPYNKAHREQDGKNQGMKNQKDKENKKEKLEQNNEKGGGKKLEQHRTTSKSDTLTPSSKANNSMVSSSSSSSSDNTIVNVCAQANTVSSSQVVANLNKSQIPAPVSGNYQSVEPWPSLSPVPVRSVTTPPHVGPLTSSYSNVLTISPSSGRSATGGNLPPPLSPTSDMLSTPPSTRIPPTSPMIGTLPTSPLTGISPASPLSGKLPNSPIRDSPISPLPGWPTVSPLRANMPNSRMSYGSPTSSSPFNHLRSLGVRSHFSDLHSVTMRQMAPCFGRAPSPQIGMMPQMPFPRSPPNVFGQRPIMFSNVLPNHLPPHRNTPLMNSPPFYQPFGSPPRQHPVASSPQTSRGPLDNVIRSHITVSNQTPRYGVISCEDLENQDIRDNTQHQATGKTGDLIDILASPSSTSEPKVEGVSPSVEQSFQLLNISRDVAADHQLRGTEGGQSKMNSLDTRHRSVSDIGRYEVEKIFVEIEKTKKSPERFLTSSNFQTDANKSLDCRIERILREAGIQVYHSSKDKLFRSLCPHNDSVNDFQKPGVYCIPCECGLVFIGETGRNLSVRLKEHKTNCEKAEVEKSAVAKHAWNYDHQSFDQLASLVDGKQNLESRDKDAVDGSHERNEETKQHEKEKQSEGLIFPNSAGHNGCVEEQSLPPNSQSKRRRNRRRNKTFREGELNRNGDVLVARAINAKVTEHTAGLTIKKEDEKETTSIKTEANGPFCHDHEKARQTNVGELKKIENNDLRQIKPYRKSHNKTQSINHDKPSEKQQTRQQARQQSRRQDRQQSKQVCEKQNRGQNKQEKRAGTQPQKKPEQKPESKPHKPLDVQSSMKTVERVVVEVDLNEKRTVVVRTSKNTEIPDGSFSAKRARKRRPRKRKKGSPSQDTGGQDGKTSVESSSATTKSGEGANATK